MKQNRNETVVGAFVIIGFIFLSLIVFFISGVYLFRPGYKVTVMYDYVSILDKGAPVRMAGVRVGEVSGVELVRDEVSQKTRVKVKLFIEKGVEIRENYEFVIRGTHILSEPHIEISPKPGNASILRGDKVIEGVMLVPVEALIDQAHAIASDLAAMLADIRGSVGNEEGAGSIKKILVNMAQLTESMNMILGGSEEDAKKSLQNIKSSTDSLDSILNKIDKGDGTMGKLLTSDELYQELRQFVTEIKAHPWRLMKKDNGGRKFLFF